MKLLIIIILLALTLIFALYITFKPEYNQTILHFREKYGNVTIYRDESGIAHIQVSKIL
jgi:acyl-homoserine lactone acylase PvdQ